jgi:hypothetical protein
MMSSNLTITHIRYLLYSPDDMVWYKSNYGNVSPKKNEKESTFSSKCSHKATVQRSKEHKSRKIQSFATAEKRFHFKIFILYTIIFNVNNKSLIHWIMQFVCNVHYYFVIKFINIKMLYCFRM